MASLNDLYKTWPHTREIILNLSRMPTNMRENADYYLANPKGKSEADLAAEIEGDAEQFAARLAAVEEMQNQAPAGFAAALAAMGVQASEVTTTIATLRGACTQVRADMRKPQKDIARDVATFKAAIPAYEEAAAADIPERFRVARPVSVEKVERA